MRERNAARLILIDSDGRVLLLRHRQHRDGWFWATPGGGVEAGESFEEAATREGREELGIMEASPQFLWESVHEHFHFSSSVRQTERYFQIARELPPLSDDVRAIHVEEGVAEMRWWSIQEIRAHAASAGDQPIFPEDLADRLETVKAQLKAVQT